jgi:hypothetical protein
MTHDDSENPIDHRLRDALRTTAMADADLGASPAVGARLLADIRRQRQAQDRHRQLSWLVAAAAIVIAITAAQWQIADNTTSPEPAPTVAAEAAAPDAVPADFLPLRYANVPARSGHIVQMVVPTTVMTSFGLEPSSASSGVVIADVFVGDDGLARAVRFDPINRELSQ